MRSTLACCAMPAARISAPAASSKRPISASSSVFVGSAAVTPETLARVPVTHRHGKPPLLLSDVADLVYRAAGHDRRCGHQRRPRPHAHRREVSLGQHARGDPRGRGGAGEDEARPAGVEIDTHDLPPGDFRRGLDPQPVMGAVAELPAGRSESYSSSFTSGVLRSSASLLSRCRCSRLDSFCSSLAPRSTP